jgi:anti-sigma regulatory factor (Ser/Thr protein kinase)
VVTSELVTNAVVHGGTEIQLSVWMTEDRNLRIEVADGNTCCDLMARPQSPEAISGRGLFLVEQLAEQWGVEANDRGKVVWATLGHRGLLDTLQG